MELGWPIEDTGTYETMAGWFMDEIGHLPVAGESIERDGYLLRVEHASSKRVSTIVVTAPDPSEGDDEGL